MFAAEADAVVHGTKRFEPAFEPSEYERRLAAVRADLQANSLAGAIYVGPEALFYLSGYDAHTHFSEQALFVPARDGDSPVLIIRDLDQILADWTSWVTDVRTYHYGADDPAELIGAVAKEKGVGSTRLGVEMRSSALTVDYWQRLSRALRDAEQIVDSSEIIARLRTIKSEAELVYTRQAARFSNVGVSAALSMIREGITEFELAAAIENEVRAAGSEYSAMPTWICSGPRTLSGHATPAERIGKDGDAVYFSFAGVSHRYHVTNYHTVHLGEPTGPFRQAYGIAEESMAALVDAVGIGHPIRDAARAANEVLGGHGLPGTFKARFGYGVGIAYPPTWLEPMDIIEESDRQFAGGMVFCLHVGVESPNDGFGIMVGGDYLLSNSGLEPLDEAGTGLRVL